MFDDQVYIREYRCPMCLLKDSDPYLFTDKKTGEYYCYYCGYRGNAEDIERLYRIKVESHPQRKERFTFGL